MQHFCKQNINNPPSGSLTNLTIETGERNLTIKFESRPS